MRINGYWSQAGWPALYALVECSFPYVRGYVEFALDTGSPFSILSQAEAEKLNVNYKKLTRASGPIVIAAFAGAPYVLKHVSITPYKSHHRESLSEIFVIPSEKELKLKLPMPSILGRDFLNRFHVIFKKGQGEIILTDEPIP
jgi:hypothetical protein